MFELKGIFVTGTDTGIGKTAVSCALLRTFKQRGLHVQGMKPVASGCTLIDGVWKNDDALALMHACESIVEYGLVNPYALPDATAPQIAARNAGVTLSLEPIQMAYHCLSVEADSVLVEGVGGWLAPLSNELDQADLVRALDIPVLMVVGMRLGCINHARLTEQAILQSGLQLLGWVANYCEVDFDNDGAYIDALSSSLNSARLCSMEFNGQLLFTHAGEPLS